MKRLILICVFVVGLCSYVESFIDDFHEKVLIMPESASGQLTLQSESNEGIWIVTDTEVKVNYLMPAIEAILQHQNSTELSPQLSYILKEILLVDPQAPFCEKRMWEVKKTIKEELGIKSVHLTPLNEKGEPDSTLHEIRLIYNMEGELTKIIPIIPRYFLIPPVSELNKIYLASVELLNKPVHFFDEVTEKDIEATLKVTITSSHALEQEREVLSWTDTYLYFGKDTTDLVYSEAFRRRVKSITGIFKKKLLKSLKDFLGEWDKKFYIIIKKEEQ